MYCIFTVYYSKIIVHFLLWFQDISVHDPSFCQYKTLSELFPVGEVAFMLGWPHYGCQGEVLDVEEGESPRVRINVTTLEEPNLAKFNDTEVYNVQWNKTNM